MKIISRFIWITVVLLGSLIIAEVVMPESEEEWSEVRTGLEKEGLEERRLSSPPATSSPLPCGASILKRSGAFSRSFNYLMNTGHQPTDLTSTLLFEDTNPACAINDCRLNIDHASLSIVQTGSEWVIHMKRNVQTGYELNVAMICSGPQ